MSFDGKSPELEGSAKFDRDLSVWTRETLARFLNQYKGGKFRRFAALFAECDGEDMANFDLPQLLSLTDSAGNRVLATALYNALQKFKYSSKLSVPELSKLVFEWASFDKKGDPVLAALLNAARFADALSTVDAFGFLFAQLDLSFKRRHAFQILEEALSAENLRVAMLVLSETAVDVNDRSESPDGSTLLMRMIRAGKTKTIPFFVEARADFEAKDTWGRNALMRAVYSEPVAGQTHPLRALLAAKPDLSLEAKDGDGLTALMHAVQLGHLLQVRILIDARANTEAQDRYGRSVLSQALRKMINTEYKEETAGPALVPQISAGAGAAPGPREKKEMEAIVQCLLDSRSTLGAQEPRDRQGRTALMHAVVDTNPVFSRALLEARANVNARDNRGQTSLMLSVIYPFQRYLEPGEQQRRLNIVRLLLEAKGDAALEDHNGKSALLMAIPEVGRSPVDKGFRDEIVRLIVSASASSLSALKKEAQQAVLTLATAHECAPALIQTIERAFTSTSASAAASTTAPPVDVKQ